MTRPILKAVFLMIIAVILSSCATKALWRATDPTYYVRVRGDLVTEDELKKKGLKYFKDDKSNAYYVEKNDFDKLRDLTLRIFATPITVVIDAATSIFVIGGVGVAGEIHREWEDTCDQDPACKEHQRRGTLGNEAL